MAVSAEKIVELLMLTTSIVRTDQRASLRRLFAQNDVDCIPGMQVGGRGDVWPSPGGSSPPPRHSSSGFRCCRRSRTRRRELLLLAGQDEYRHLSRDPCLQVAESRDVRDQRRPQRRACGAVQLLSQDREGLGPEFDGDHRVGLEVVVPVPGVFPIPRWRRRSPIGRRPRESSSAVWSAPPRTWHRPDGSGSRRSRPTTRRRDRCSRGTPR